MTCPACGEVLVQVDNPHRQEIRHRRGSTCRWWQCTCGQWTQADECSHQGPA